MLSFLKRCEFLLRHIILLSKDLNLLAGRMLPSGPPFFFFLELTSLFLSHLVSHSFISLKISKMSPKQRVIIYFGQLVKRLALELERWPGVLECLLLFHRTRGSVPSTHTGDPQLPVTTGLTGPRLSSGLNSHALSANTCK